MLSLPGIKEFIKNRDGRKQTPMLHPDLFVRPNPDSAAGMASYLVHLARGLCLDVLVFIETNGGKSAEMTAAGKQGLTCNLTIPALENAGPLSALVAQGQATGGTGKLFTKDEVFPCEATWCDFIPMDSNIVYFFIPMIQIPTPGHLQTGSRKAGSGRFVLAASTGEGEDPGLPLKAVAAASMLSLSLTESSLASADQMADGFKTLVKHRGYSLLVVKQDGTVTEKSGSIFSEIDSKTLTKIAESAIEQANRSGRAGGSPYRITLEGIDRLIAYVYPLSSYTGSSAFIVALKWMAAQPESDAPSDARREQMAMLSRFMSSIAHEIKNPLTGIAAGVQYLSKKLQQGATEDDTVGFVLAEINRLNRIVDDLYRIAKPPDLMLAETSVNDVVAKSLLSLSEEILKKGLTVQQDLRTDIPTLQADGDRLQQVLINIIKNAVEASPDRGIIRIETACEGSNVVTRIVDSGPGIPMDNRRRIFEPFYSSKHGGTGLGLCISQRIVDQHGGSIYIEDSTEGGTTVAIELPIRS
jgi:signal transduction histidine kinase